MYFFFRYGYAGFYHIAKNPETLDDYKHFRIQEAGDERIELPPKVLETPIIPFDQSPKIVYDRIIHATGKIVKIILIKQNFSNRLAKGNNFRFAAEMEGFEPSRRLPGLPHFECGPFSHLGTSPYEKHGLWTAYYYIGIKAKGQFIFLY